MEFKKELSSANHSSTNTHQNDHGDPPQSLLMAGRSLQATQKRKAGRKKFQETRHPVYKGVRRRNEKWVCELREPHNNKSRLWLGTFASPDMAARAYDVAAFALRGDAASLNFPESAHLLPRAKSTSLRDIQFAALKAADDKSTATTSGGGGGLVDDDQFQYSLTSSSSSSSSVEESEKLGEDWNKKMNVFMDEDELFNMPALLDSMAEGLILTPPAMKKGFSWIDVEDDDPVDLVLWND